MATESNLIALKKVTLRYIRVEDRIRMDATVAEENESFTFWLTLRMCQVLVAAMVKHLASTGVAKGVSAPADVAAVQGFYHQQAKSAKKKTAPVTIESQRTLLVDRVQLRNTDKAIQIAFPFPDEGGQAMLPLTLQEARQWLDILYRQYQAGEWPLDVWPQWMRDDKPSEQKLNAGKPLH